MTAEFSQPAWTPESGLPYPGAESAAEAITQDQQRQQIDAQAEVDKMRIMARRQAERKVEVEEAVGRRVGAIDASSVRPKRVRWLWAPGAAGHGRIPMGELTLCVGRGGVGKSTLLCEWTAWITTGRMEGEFFGQPKDVLYVANEDSLEYTVVPRLIAAGADLERVHFLRIEELGEERSVILPTDCDRIGEYANEKNAVVIMLDPLSSNLRVENGNDPRKVRPVIEAVRRMCERWTMAAVGLAHTRKASSANLMDAILGSSELGNVCRSAMGVMLNVDDPDAPTVVLSQEKSNLGRTDIPSYEYRIVTEIFVSDGETISTGKVEWIGKTDRTVSEMLADQMQNPGGGGGSVGEAAQWMTEYLRFHGPTPRTKVMAEGRKEGYNESALKRAQKKANVTVSRQGYPATSVWSAPIS